MKKISVLARVFALIGLVMAFSFTALPVMGAASGPLTIKTMKLSIWPEYDDPRILVIYQGEFNNGSSFPNPVEFPVPMGSEINQVCALKKPADEHLCQLYDTLPKPDGLAISYTLPISTYFMEYYWDGISGQPDKSFTYKYVAPYAIDTLNIDVAQPLRSTDYKLAPTYATATSDSAGIKYYNYSFTNVAAGQEITIDASYTKPDSRPSVAKKQAGVAGSGGGSPYTVALIALAAAIVAAVGFFAYKRRPAPAAVRSAQARRAAMMETARQNAARKAPRQDPSMQPRADINRVGAAGRQAPSAKQTPAKANAGVAFCSKCGMKIEADDNFCPGCGEKPRRRS